MASFCESEISSGEHYWDRTEPLGRELRGIWMKKMGLLNRDCGEEVSFQGCEGRVTSDVDFFIWPGRRRWSLQKGSFIVVLGCRGPKPGDVAFMR